MDLLAVCYLFCKITSIISSKSYVAGCFNIRTFSHKRLVFCLCECKPNCYTLYQNFLDSPDKPAIKCKKY